MFVVHWLTNVDSSFINFDSCWSPCWLCRQSSLLLCILYDWSNEANSLPSMDRVRKCELYSSAQFASTSYRYWNHHTMVTLDATARQQTMLEEKRKKRMNIRKRRQHRKVKARSWVAILPEWRWSFSAWPGFNHDELFSGYLCMCASICVGMNACVCAFQRSSTWPRSTHACIHARIAKRREPCCMPADSVLCS